jgi:hypothetical protein
MEIQWSVRLGQQDTTHRIAARDTQSVEWRDTRNQDLRVASVTLVYHLMLLPLFPSPLQSKIGSGEVVVHCACPTRAFFSLLFFTGVAKAALDCAHRTSTVISCAFCEQGGHLATPSSSFPGRAFREQRTDIASVLPLPYFSLRPLPQPNDIILVLDPDKPADNQGKDEEFLPLFVHDRHDWKAPEGRQRATG